MLPNLRSGLPDPRPWNNPGTILPQCQIKYSTEDKQIGNKYTIRKCNDQIRLAERMMSESRRVLDDVIERSAISKRETDHQIQERIAEVKFLYEEMQKQRKAAALEVEALNTANDRVEKAIKNIARGISMCKQCLAFREGRIGIDLCVDEVERKLLNELNAMIGAQAVLENTNKKTVEQLRSLRAVLYLIDEDVGGKDKAVQIDIRNLTLQETFSNLGEGVDLSKNVCYHTLQEWQQMSADIFKKASNEITNAFTLRGYVDLMLRQTCEDINEAIKNTTFAFKTNIDILRKFKRDIEERHRDGSRRINDILADIQMFQDKLKEKERSLLLCQTRLSNRSSRAEKELVCDYGQQALLLELNTLQRAICQIKQKLEENKAVMRYLMHTNIIVEEEINVKANSLKIDEVDCLCLRQTLKIGPF